MKRLLIITLCIELSGLAACATPTARAMESYASSTPYWSFLWALQTPSITPIPGVSATNPFPTITQPIQTSPAFTVPAVIESATSTTVPVPTNTALPRGTPTPTALSATVTVGFLSCRYGPGPEYLYLYALRKGANIKLIGRTDGDNWHWAWVEGRNRCWVNTSYLSVAGDWHQLPVVYPGIARLPVSPYYPPTKIVGVVRSGNAVTVEWQEIPLRAGDEEDDSMQHYILEVWHCQGGRFIFEPLATNYTFLTVVDEPGCASASHARVFVQEKHGFSGPTSVPWRPIP